jgi:hypothetical protein
MLFQLILSSRFLFFDGQFWHNTMPIDTHLSPNFESCGLPSQAVHPPSRRQRTTASSGTFRSSRRRPPHGTVEH